MKALSLLGAGLVGLLFFIWPIPHTIAARNLLILANLAVLGYVAHKTRPGWAALYAELKIPVWLALAFTGWLLFGALLISGETSWAMGEIAGQWGKALLALGIGVMAGQLAVGGELFSRNSLLLILFASLAIHVLYVDFTGLKGLWETGALTRRLPGLTEGPDKSNFLTNIFLALLLAEGCYRLTTGRRQLPFGGPVVVLFAAAGVFSSYLEAVRNGMIVLVFLASAAALIYLRGRSRAVSRRTWGLAAAVLAAGMVFVGAYVKSDPRWQTFAETIPLALDTQTHKAWLDETRHPFPTLAGGAAVDNSNYIRIAFIKEGLLLVRDHPLGIGYGRNAFAHGLQAKYGYQKVGHSHSGLIDLAIGTGIPGVLLWLGLMASLAGIAYRRLAMQPTYFALLLLLLLIDFNFRMVLDSINRDHALEQFMFLVGLLGVLMFKEKRPAGTAELEPPMLVR